MSLATADDLENRLGRSLTDEETARHEAVLEDVSGSVEMFTGRFFEAADRELRTRVKRGKVRLPQRPVNAVDSVTDRFDNDITYTFDGIDTVFIDCCQFTGQAPIQVVDITYNAGPATVPQQIVGVVCGITLRALGVDPTEAAITQESVDGYAFTIGSVGGSGAYGVLPSEAVILRQFKGRRNLGSIQVAW